MTWLKPATKFVFKMARIAILTLNTVTNWVKLRLRFTAVSI